ARQDRRARTRHAEDARDDTGSECPVSTPENDTTDEFPVDDQTAEEAAVHVEEPASDAAPEAADEVAPASAEEDEPDPVEQMKAVLRRAPGDWYVIHSYAGYENKVKTNLETRV